MPDFAGQLAAIRLQLRRRRCWSAIWIPSATLPMCGMLSRAYRLLAEMGEPGEAVPDLFRASGIHPAVAGRDAGSGGL
ncbi:MAG: hypothetical protein R3C44_16435 [Chloroflexota bacterium]